jgi:UDP-3-O-[3-hydroxymyristoyl] glucosamine N-acyltransferase
MIGVPLVASETLAALAARLGGEADPGAGERQVSRVVAPAQATRDTDLCLVASRRVLQLARAASGIALVTPELASELPAGGRWVHPHALWVVSQLLAPCGRPQPDGIHPTALIEGALIGPGTRIGAGAVVFAGAELGAACAVEPGAVIYPGSRLGARVVVGAQSVIGRPGFGWATAPDGRLERIPQLGGVEIEDDVEIGALVTVDAGTLGPTRIGAGAKLDSHVHVGHNVVIGPGCLVAAQAGFAGSAQLGAGVLVGGQAGFADHVSVGAGARVAAKSGVIGDIAEGRVVAGFPAVPRVRWLRAMARLMALARPATKRRR